jgi:ubiquinone/menaquinone biosynthesis C-methylase UbiE
MHERRFDPSRAHLLDDPERKKWLPPAEVIDALHLKDGEIVADIGAGTGYFALPMAALVGRNGLVFALDLAPEMLARLRSKIEAGGVENVKCVEGTAESSGLASGCADVVFMANVWHEFDDSAAVLREAQRVLAAGGRIAILDWRPDVEPDHGPPIAHRIPLSAVKGSCDSVGLVVHFSGNVGRYSWLLIASRDEGGF